ncbi:C-terminal domain of homeodomain 1-domain-containing protein [Mycena epipterygia]|nr:C-terminal domain of homeodomain 1-domain-containing protein [Mycena epipterygia]
MSSSPEIRQRLLSIEREFIPILSGDDVEAAVAFSQRWSQLHADVEAALHTNSLDDETSALAHSIGSKISISADLFLSFRTISGNVTDQLERMFDDRLNLDAPAPPHPNAPDLVPTITRPDASLPSYIEPAYRWLLKHLHNPYPSKDVKQKFADETGSTVERISDWFVDVRRRMGWTLLLREEFGRKRNDMIDAARRFYISPDRRYPLSPDIHGRFVEMEAYAHEMYAAKFLPSALSTKLTTAVKDLTPELQEKARKERWEKLQAQREAAKYPSPVSSGASSPISDPGASTSLAGRKRSSSEASDDYDSFRKRSRNDDGSEGVALPSPPDSRDSTPTFTSIPSRKRRLSDADTAGAAKRPRNRATSDPIPVTVTLAGTPHILADWYSSDREGDTNLFESGQLLDIKFFDPSEYEIPLDTPAAPSEPVLRGKLSPIRSSVLADFYFCTRHDAVPSKHHRARDAHFRAPHVPLFRKRKLLRFPELRRRLAVSAISVSGIRALRSH